MRVLCILQRLLLQERRRRCPTHLTRSAPTSNCTHSIRSDSHEGVSAIALATVAFTANAPATPMRHHDRQRTRTGLSLLSMADNVVRSEQACTPPAVCPSGTNGCAISRWESVEGVQAPTPPGVLEKRKRCNLQARLLASAAPAPRSCNSPQSVGCPGRGSLLHLCLRLACHSLSA